MNVETLASLAEKINQNSDAPFRRKELDLFRKKGLSELVQDSYKFTNLETFFAGLRFSGDFTGTLSLNETAFPTIKLKDGHLGELPKLPEGVSLKLVSPEEIENVLSEKNPLSHLHHGLLKKILLIEVAKRADVTTPLRLQHVLTGSTLIGVTTVIKAGSQSRFSLIEETFGAPGTGHAFLNETHLIAADGATLEHVSLDEESGEGLNHSSVFADAGRDAHVRSVILSTSGKMNRKNLELNLNEAGANGESFILYLTSGTEHSDVNTVINHKAADTTSDQLAKGILDGDSKGIFTGKIHIYPKAQRVSSGQLNKNLLLSKKAQAHSQPQLEIFADDVKCSHGSTTGQLSPDELFYFQARGIPEAKARTLLAFGFGLEVVQKIQNQKLQEHVASVIKAKLASKFTLGTV